MGCVFGQKKKVLLGIGYFRIALNCFEEEKPGLPHI